MTENPDSQASGAGSQLEVPSWVGIRRMKRLIRYRMAATGEKYMTARRALLSDSDALSAAAEQDKARLNRKKYPFTPRDGLSQRHVLSAWETARRSH